MLAIMTTAQKRTEQGQSRWEPCKALTQSSREPRYQVLAQVSPLVLLKTLLQTVPPTEERAGAAHIACAQYPFPPPSTQTSGSVFPCSAAGLHRRGAVTLI